MFNYLSLELKGGKIGSAIYKLLKIKFNYESNFCKTELSHIYQFYFRKIFIYLQQFIYKQFINLFSS